MSIVSQLYVLGYGYGMFGMYDIEILLYLLFFYVFLLSLFAVDFAGTDTLQHHCISSSSAHHLLLLVDTLSFSISLTSVSFSATWDSTVTTFILINLWSSGTLSSSSLFQCTCNHCSDVSSSSHHFDGPVIFKCY